MQLVHTKENIIEKIIRDADGRLVRATFAVYENGGRIKARLLHAVFLDESVTIESNRILSLGGFVPLQTISSGILPFAKIVSPYFSNNLLYSLGSKPRAPTR